MYKWGFTFLEIIIALTILSVALLGFSQIFSTALNASYRAAQESIATNLGRGLMAEIMSKNFVEDPTMNPPPALGPDGTESRFGGSGNAFDDVDDYHGYSESPPISVGGLPMDGTAGTPDYSKFSRSVSVKYVDFLADGTYNDNPSGNTNYKKVTVTVNSPYARNIIIEEVKAK